MSYKLWLGIVCGLLLQASLFSQQVLRVNRPYVRLDVDPSSGVEIGDDLLVYRYGADDQLLPVAKVRAYIYRDGQLAAEIMGESKENPLRVGDLVNLPGETIQGKTLRELARGEESRLSAPRRIFGPRRQTWLSYSLISLGIVSSGLGMHFNREAGDLAGTHPVSMDHYMQLVKDVKKYDDRTNFCYALGGGMLAAGLIHYLFFTRTPLPPQSAIMVEPVTRPGFYGFGLSLALNKP